MRVIFDCKTIFQRSIAEVIKFIVYNCTTREIKLYCYVQCKKKKKEEGYIQDSERLSISTNRYTVRLVRFKMKNEGCVENLPFEKKSGTSINKERIFIVPLK